MPVLELWTLPLILSTSKYYRYNFRGWNEQVQIKTKAWKGPSWTFFMPFKYLTLELLRKYFEFFFVIFELQFHHEGNHFLHHVLLDRVPLFTMQNFVSCWAPLLPFINIFQNIDKVILLKHFSFFFCAKSGFCLYQSQRFYGRAG